MSPIPRMALLAVALVALALGCGDAAPGTVAGDVYLAEGLKQEIDLARIPVHLVKEEAELDSTLARICPSRGGTTAPTQAAREQAWRERARILQGHVLKTVTTDEKAQFVIDSIEPGRYRLWADTSLEAARWTWLQRVNVRPGDTVRIGLSNANSDEDPFRCRS